MTRKDKMRSAHVWMRGKPSFSLLCRLAFLCLGLREQAVNPLAIISERCQSVNMGVFLDTSNNALTDEWIFTSIQDFLTRVIGRLDIATDKSSVGLVQFATVPSIVYVDPSAPPPTSVSQTVFNFSTYHTKHDMYDAIYSMVPLISSKTTSTAFWNFLTDLRNVATLRPSVHTVAVLVTDGESLVDYAQATPVADALRYSQITVLVVGINVTAPLVRSNLLAVAGNIASNVVYVNSYVALFTVVDNIVGLQCVSDTTPAPCQTRTDIAFILHEGSSVVFGDTSHNSWYRDVLGLVSSLALYFNVSSDLTRVGVVKYSSTAEAYINFFNYTSVDTLLPAVRGLILDGGQTNIAAGLRVAGTSLFTVNNGFRPDASSVAVLISANVANQETDQTQLEATRLKNVLGVEVFTVGVGSLIDLAELQHIASSPSRTHCLTVDAFENLDDLVPQLASTLCNATKGVKSSTPVTASTHSGTTTRSTTAASVELELTASTTTTKYTLLPPSSTTTKPITAATTTTTTKYTVLQPTGTTTQTTPITPAISVTPVATTTTTTTSTTTSHNMTTTTTRIFGAMNPSFGPVAGGTTVTLTFDVVVPLYLLFISFNNQNSNSTGARYTLNDWHLQQNQLTFVTSAVQPDETGAWSVSLVFPASSSEQMYLASAPFIYRSNPLIQAILPANQSIFGGTRMTVSGKNLNAVAYPVVHALVKIYRSGPGQQNMMTADTPRICTVDETVDDQMICPMPDLHLPQDFIDKLKEDMYNETDQSGTRRKRRNTFVIPELLHRWKRQALPSYVQGPNNSYAEVHLSFVFDAYLKYVNGTSLDSTLNYLKPIQIPPGPDLLSYNPLSDRYIRIKGQNMLRVGSMSDYSILIGGDTCIIAQLTDNLLTCSPPIMIPARQLNDTIYCSKAESLEVQVAFAEGAPYYYSCLVYESDHTGQIIAGLTGGITSLLVAITIIITIIVCCCQHSRQSTKQDTGNQEQADDRFKDAAEAADDPESLELYNRDFLKLESLRKPIFSEM